MGQLHSTGPSPLTQPHRALAQVARLGDGGGHLRGRRGGGLRLGVAVQVALHLKANFETSFSLYRFKG